MVSYPAFLIVPSLVFGYSGLFDGSKNEQQGFNSGLERASRYLLDSIDTKVDPCVDFYGYTCGGWKRKNKIPDDSSSISAYSSLQTKVVRRLQDALSTSTNKNGRSKSSAVEKARLAYRACMNQKQLNEIGTSELQKELKRLGGWPLIGLQTENDDDLDLTTFIINMYKERPQPEMIIYTVTPDIGNSSQYVLEFSVTSQLFGAHEYYLQDRYSEMVGAIENYTRKIASLVAGDFGLSVNETELNEQIEDFIEFNRQLARIKNATASNGPLKDSLVIPLSGLDYVFPMIDWSRLLKETWSETAEEELQGYLDSNPKIYIVNVDEFFALTKLLLITSPKTIVNHFVLSYISKRALYLDERFDKIYQEILHTKTGKKTPESRGETCTYHAWSMFPLAIDSLYINTYFKPETKKQVEEMLAQMRNVFDDIIHRNSWMSNKTKEYASKKLKNMISFVGFSPQMNDSKKIDANYRQIELSSTDTFFQIAKKVIRSKAYNHLRKLLDRPDQETSAIDAVVVNAQYEFRNIMSVPAAILQPPFFDPDFPRVFHYAGLGSVLAHEISHSFDQTGSHFDINGTAGNDWWDPESRKRFENQTECFMEQYSNYPVPPEIKMHVNGNQTLDENIADAGGLKISLYAFKRYVDKESPCTIPGFEHFSTDQIFFMAYAAVYCTNESEQEYIDDFLSDEHSPQPARVNLAVANQPEFAKAFKCPPNSLMNPARRCNIW